MLRTRIVHSILSLALILELLLPTLARADITLLNVSYDLTRELYQELREGERVFVKPRNLRVFLKDV